MENSEILNLAQDILEYRDGKLFWAKLSSPLSRKKVGDRAGWLDPSGYRYISLKGKRYIEHRVIYLLHNPDWDINDGTQQIDHINRVRDDNRIENLRLVTNQENAFNRNARGYTWYKPYQKWHSQIEINGTKKHLGFFDYKTDARLAYLEAKKEHHIIEDRK